MSMGALVLAGGAISVAALFWSLSQERLGYSDADPAHVLWRVCAGICCGIALSAALNLDARLLAIFRGAFHTVGWYQWRRPVQACLMLGGLFLLVQSFVWLRTRVENQPSWPASVKVALIACLVLLGLWWARLLSWHATDAWMNMRLHGMGLGRWLELLVLTVAGLSGAAEWAYRWSWR